MAWGCWSAVCWCRRICGPWTPMSLKPPGGKRRAWCGKASIWPREGNLGAARLLWEAAQMEGLPDREQLRPAVTNLAAQRPDWMIFGSPNARLEKLSARPAGRRPPTARRQRLNAPTVHRSLVPTDVRDRALGMLETLPQSRLQELLRCAT